MLTKKQIAEIDKIERAVDEFADQIKRRMIEKYEAGVRGWDKMGPLDCYRMAKQIRRGAAFSTYNPDSSKKLIDIGARAMILWHRKG